MLSVKKNMSNICNKYDVIIIGSGIGGLVCGCYLAKAGLKVLIIEKNDKVGGYCTSFNREGFVFDAGFHCLGSCGEKGYFRKIINDLELSDSILLKKVDPANIIITPDYKIKVFSDINRTRDVFKDSFPNSATQIDNFFNLVNIGLSSSEYLMLRNTSFYELLSKYFNDSKIKSFFSILLANIGVSSRMISAFASIIFLKEFIFNG